jgi:ribosomal-protein-alanine N-acetyltransferase
MAIASRVDLFPSTIARSATPATAARVRDWRTGLPVLLSGAVALRELRASDAPALLAAFGSPEVTRLISPPPPTLDGFEKFVAWTQRQREAGQSFAFGITLRDSDTVVGLFQVRALQPGFDIAEWGFALSSEHWGSGLFTEAAELILEFVFNVIGVHRLEARAALQNGRGNGALYKLGATQEGVLHRSFLRNGVYLDQALWTILADDRRNASALPVDRLVH